jgi:hypothetical protein
MNEQQRIAVVSGILSGLIAQGMTHAQVKLAVNAMAEAAVVMSPADLILCMQSDDDHESMRKLANVPAGPVAVSLLATLASQLGGWAGTRAGKLTDGITSLAMRAAPAVAVAAPVALAGGAYLTGKGLAEMAGDDASQIKEIQHQELVAALRRNAENYRRHGKGQQDGSDAA